MKKISSLTNAVSTSKAVLLTGFLRQLSAGLSISLMLGIVGVASASTDAVKPASTSGATPASTEAVKPASAASKASDVDIAQLPVVKAQVKRVDQKLRKLNLSHEAIPNLDMPPMTMVFYAVPALEIKDVKVGDTVWVKVSEANGKMTVHDLMMKAPTK